MSAAALAGLQAALDADPLDTVARCALADWWEEQGDDEAAACMRWMSREGKAPDPPEGPLGGSAQMWGWRDGRSPLVKKKESDIRYRQLKAASLPDCFLRIMPGLGYGWILYSTRQRAEAGLLAAWRALPPSERPAV